MRACVAPLEKRRGRRVAVWWLVAGVTTVGYFAVDHLYALWDSNYLVRPEGLTVGVTFIWVALALALRSRGAALLAALFFAAAQWGQFLHFAYYGAPIAPHEPPLLFSEWREIVGAFAGTVHHYTAAIVLPLVSLLFFAVGWWLNRRYGLQGRLWPLLLFVALLSVLPVKAYRAPDNTQAFYPRPYGYALKNAWLVTSYAIGSALAHGGHTAVAGEAATAQPYRVERVGDGVDGVVVVVMGESTNPAMMSAFGAPEPTTPFLASLAASGAIVTVGQSAGVATKVSLPMFFNVQREPWRHDIPVAGKSNLIALAQANGYRVVVESAQTNNLFTFTRAEWADHFCAVDRCHPERPEAGVDTVLLERVAAEPFDRKTLLILHTRVAHSAYDRFLPEGWRPFPVDEKSREAQMRSTYRNAAAWFDELVRRITEAIRAKTTQPIWFVLTGDHNELLGEGGYWGHGQLAERAGEVPVVVATWNGAELPSAWRDRLRCRPSHYELGQLVAALLGWEVRSPDEAPDQVLTNGPDLTGKAGWIELEREVTAEGECRVHERLVFPGQRGALR